MKPRRHRLRLALSSSVLVEGRMREARTNPPRVLGNDNSDLAQIPIDLPLSSDSRSLSRSPLRCSASPLLRTQPVRGPRSLQLRTRARATSNPSSLSPTEPVFDRDSVNSLLHWCCRAKPIKILPPSFSSPFDRSVITLPDCLSELLLTR